MDSKNIWKMQGAIAAFLILFVFFVPIPKIASLFLVWVILILLIKILSGSIMFSFFLSTAFVATLFIFLIYKSKQDQLELRQAFFENFQVENKDSENKDVEKIEEKVEENNGEKKLEEKVEEKKVDDNGQSSQSTSMAMTVDEVIAKKNEEPPTIQQTVVDPNNFDKPNPLEVNAMQESLPGGEKKISMMASDNGGNNSEDDFFGKLNTGEFEDSDDDSDDDEKELEKKSGKTTVSSKQSYRAQKQLYDLTTAVEKLHSNMEKLAPSLKKGQKIIESIQSMGIKLV